jgi:hypothetical protein
MFSALIIYDHGWSCFSDKRNIRAGYSKAVFYCLPLNAPKFTDGKWIERPENPREIVIWENFDKEKIMQDFYNTIENYNLAK